MKELSEMVTCYDCGWRGWCVIACPLPDPAAMIIPDRSTAPGLEAEEDEPFEIVVEPAESPSSPDGAVD